MSRLIFLITVLLLTTPLAAAQEERPREGAAQQPACGLPFDHYAWRLKFNDERARLDNFAIALHMEPAATGYIMLNPGKRARPDEVRRRAKRARAYLKNKRGLDPERVVLVYGSDTVFEGSTVLLIMPRDVKFPFPGEIIK